MSRFIAGLAVAPSLVSAWNKDGHEAVGMTASSAHVKAASQHIKQLFDGAEDLVDVSYWAHERADTTYEWARKLHFQSQPDTCELANAKCEDDGNLCLLPQIKHFYNQLHKSLDQDAVQVVFPNFVEWTDQDAVKMLSNLIADLHQPLHVGWASWDFGRNKKVNFRGKEMTAYEFWDHQVVQTVVDEQPGFWYY